MQRPANFAALLGLTRAASAIGDYWVNAAKAVSTPAGVSVPGTKSVSRTNHVPGSDVAVVERRRLAPSFTLVGVS